VRVSRRGSPQTDKQKRPEPFVVIQGARIKEDITKMIVSLNRKSGEPNDKTPRADQRKKPCRLVDFDLSRGLAWVHTEGRLWSYEVGLYTGSCTCPGYKSSGRCYHGAHAFRLVFEAVGESPAAGRSVYEDFMGYQTDGEREADFRQGAEWSEVDGAVFQVLWGGNGRVVS
jgi:hypothetical protein